VPRFVLDAEGVIDGSENSCSMNISTASWRISWLVRSHFEVKISTSKAPRQETILNIIIEEVKADATCCYTLIYLIKQLCCDSILKSSWLSHRTW
jgi:hypothetical protein